MIHRGFILIFICYFFVPLQSWGQEVRDTVYFKVKTEMIDQTRVFEDKLEGIDSYTLSVQLKEKYHSEFEKITGDNIDNILAVTYEGEIISHSLPVIIAEISHGRISLKFNKEQKAREVMRQLVNEQK